MTRQEALQYDNELKNYLMLVAAENGLSGEIGANIVDNYIIITPDDVRKGMFFLGKDAVSYKFGNIFMNLKKALAAGLELAASVSQPESLFNYIQLLITCVLFIQKTTSYNINKIEAYIVYWLHIHNKYEYGVVEDVFIDEFKQWYQEQVRENVEFSIISEAIGRLYQIKAIEIFDGKLYLKEHVIGYPDMK